MGAHHQYSEEQLVFLKDNYKHMLRRELADAFNEKFGTHYALSTIKALCVRNGWLADTDGRFTSETSPRWQKGLSKEEFKSHYSDESLKRMTTPMIEGNRVLHVGDTFMRHGIPYILLDDSTVNKPIELRGMAKARYIWEQAYGKIENNDLIIHLDNDVMNCDLENLARIPQAWRANFIHNGWWHAPADIKRAAIEWCKLQDAIKGAIG